VSSDRLRSGSGLARSGASTRALGNGGVVLLARCRVGERERRCRRGPGCTGT
jgi:hypothetical protein